jgi:hypothetical protein
MSKLSRNKGKAYERAVARRYREIFGDKVRRGWQVREGDDEADIVGAGPFAPECKHRRAISVPATMAQAVENACPGQWPVCHLKWHRGPDVVVIERWLKSRKGDRE